MNKISLGLFSIALTTLMLELTLVRIFDVIWYSNMAYMVITLAMFCFGLSGIYCSLRPFPKNADIHSHLSRLSFCFAVSAVAILPALNYIPFDFDMLYSSSMVGGALFLVMYFFLIIPFFLAGLIFSIIFSRYAEKIQNLYCWDLTGAAIGCLILVPFLPPIGPGGILFIACSLGLLASGCFSQNKTWGIVAGILAIAIATVPFVKDGYFDFKHHINKRGVKSAADKQITRDTRWDPISKIDVIDFGTMKHIAYDGGSQSTFVYPFLGGDFKKLRERVEAGHGNHFYGSPVYISHALKKDTGHEVLVIGAAGGSETKAALMYGAGHVDAVELVGYVVELGKTKYARYNGNIYNHPNVNAFRGEGRSFLRSTERKYDIIQMFSNHTSSSIAAGSGAMATNYLQTAEAYMEYFTHLKPDGILHVNHHVYPKMVTTAALAWKQLGKSDFAQHILVFERNSEDFIDNLPTMLIKMSAWTADEIATIQAILPDHLAVDPIHPETNMLTPEFFTGDLSEETIRRTQFRVAPSTDDRPYFNFLRKKVGKLEEDPTNFVNFSTAGLLNSQLKNDRIPTDIIHLLVTGGASVLFIIVFLLLPMMLSRAGKTKWAGKGHSLVYFSCLGAGFILIELVFIQIFMKLIGYPLYTYSTIVFALLIAAGIGSAFSGRLGITVQNRWTIPFIGILICSVGLLAAYDSYFALFMQSSTIIRILAAIALIFPLGFFLGMPFPLGILALEHQPNGSIAWAWAMNGLFTVIGGLASVLLSIQWGFTVTIAIAICIYAYAFFEYSRLRLAVV
jgi:spermidine synthase